MGERSGYAHGIPSWVDLATRDIEGAKAFYGALFGWEAMDVPTGDQPGTYSMFMKDGKVVAGMGELGDDDETSPTIWSTYLAVDNLDTTLEKIVAAGGTVLVPAMDVMDTGRMAFVADPTGAAVGLWQAGTHTGAQLVNEHGTLTWNELLTDDTAAATDFYRDVFGYRVEVTAMPNGPYTTFWADGNLEGHAAAGMMARTPEMGEFPNYWSVYFTVDDVDASVAAAAEHGATILAPGFDAEGVGRFAVIMDPGGATFSVMAYENPMD
ncbi:MAG: VOC family protein [Acidimicrobiia bacterium]|nr:VOC family protein [Acidimicrobiia bacterium]